MQFALKQTNMRKNYATSISRVETRKYAENYDIQVKA